MRILFFFILFGLTKSYSQTKIEGIVLDSTKKPLSFASIQLVDKQTNLTESYTSTNENGFFSLITSTPQKKYYLKVRLLGYKPNNLNLIRFNKLVIILEENTQQLNEVVISGSKLYFKKSEDTIKYNLSRIIDSTEINLKDIVEKLPGLTIDKQKKISFQGKRIEKVTIDGQDFFGKKHEMATDNLKAEAVKGIQLLKNYKDFDDISTKKTGKIVLNIILNKEYKNKIAGNIEGNIGFIEKHQVHLNIFKFLNQGNFAFISESNNIGEPAINMVDYIEMRGGIKNFIKNKQSDGSQTLEIDHSKTPRFVFVNKNIDSRRTLFNSLNYTNTLSKKTKINGYITFDNTKIREHNNSIKKYITDNYIVIKEDKTVLSNSLLGNSFFNLSYKNNVNEILSYNLKFNPIRDKIVSDINQQFHINTNKNIKGFSLGQRLSYKKQFNSKHFMEFSIFNDIQKLNNYRIIKADSTFLGLTFSNNYEFSNSEKEKLNSTNFDISSHYKFNGQTNLESETSYSFDNKSIVNKSKQNSFNYNLKNRKNIFILKNTLSHRLSGHFLAKIGLTYIHNNLSINKLTQKQHWSLPYFLLRYKPNNNKSINFSFFQIKNHIPVFHTNPKQVVKDFQTIVNPNKDIFTPISKQNFNLNYNSFNGLNNKMFSIGVNYFSYKNAISFNTVFKDNYIRQNYIRISETGFNIELSYYGSIKTLPIKYGFSSFYNHTNTISYFNNKKNKKNITSNRLRLNLNSTFKSSSTQAKIRFEYNNIIDKNNFTVLNYSTHKIDVFPEIYGKINSLRWHIGYSFTNIISNVEMQYINSVNFSLLYQVNKRLELFSKGENILNLKNNQIINQLNTPYFSQFTKFEQLEGNILIGLRYHF